MAQNVTIDLNQIRAAGVYTFEFDFSENIVVAPQTLRVVVGFSRRGVFNSPVFCPDIKTFRNVYGEIDRELERRGSFFHRSAEECLRTGPIFALNLLKLENQLDEAGIPTNNADVTSYRSFSVDVTDKNGFGEWDVPEVTPDIFPFTHPDFTGYNLRLTASYFQKERFWKVDKKFFLNTRTSEDSVKNANGKSIGGKILNFTNLGKTPMSIIITKSPKNETQLFNITAKEWFGSVEDVPSYMKVTDFISDYFIDVYLIRGNYGKSQFEQLSSDTIFRNYFSERGLRTNRLNNLISDQVVPLIGKIRGSIVPNIIDDQGVNYFIEDIINRQFTQTGLFCAVDVSEIDRIEAGTNKYFIDLVGHRLLDVSNFTTNNPDFDGTIDFLSYRSPLRENLGYARVSTPDNPISIIGPTFGQWEANVDVLDNSLIEPHIIFDPIIGGAGSKFSITVLDTIDTVLYSGIFGKLATLSTNASYFVLDAKLTQNSPLNTQVEKLYAKVVKVVPTLVGINAAFVIELENLTEISGNPLGQETVLSGIWDSIELDLTGGAETQIWFDRNVFVRDGSGDFYYAGRNSKFFTDFRNGNVTNLDKIFVGIGPNEPNYFSLFGFVKIEQEIDPNFKDAYLKVSLWDEDFTKNNSAVTITVPFFGDEAGSPKSYIKNSSNPNTPNALEIVTDNTINIVSNTGSLNTFVDARRNPDTSVKNRVFVPDIPLWRSEIRVGNFIRCFDIDGSEILSRIVRVRGNVELPANSSTFWLDVETEAPIVTFNIPEETISGYPINTRIEVWEPIENSLQFLDPTYLQGFPLKEKHLPNNTESRLEEIYGLLDGKIGQALASKEIIQYRYLIDTFNLGLRASSGAKRFLTRIAKNRGQAMAFVNAPSVEEFINSSNPIFTELPTPSDPLPLLNTRYIATGGNLEQNPSELYSLPALVDGASHAGFFTPNLTITDGNSVIQVPPAAYVSNQFIQKNLNGNPFAVVAGLRRGTITGENLTGLEYEYLQEDRAEIEPFGLNPIIKNRQGIIHIFGNRTAYQRRSSALNNLHVRDILITITVEIEAILEQFLFDFNNDTNRQQIESLINNYLDRVITNGGIESFSVKMDRSNNPPTITSQNLGFIDVSVTFEGIMARIVNRINILPQGGFTTGGFTPV